jgi:general secretion pathway protein C
MATPFDSAAPKTGFAGNLAVAALVLLLAYQLAHWTWVFLAPAPVASIPRNETGIDLSAIARLFGAAPPGNAASASGLRLKGVIAPTPGTAASAIFSTGAGRDIAVYVDGDIKPGVKLVEVDPDHVIVSRAGERERIDLEARRSAPSRSAAGRGPAGFRLNVAKSGTNNFALSRKELDQALRDPGQLNYLGQIGFSPNGGVRMDAAPSGSLAQKLGLQPGDVIRKVNGQSIASSGDLARLYQQFATLSLVQAEVQRGSATVQLSYAIQP